VRALGRLRGRLGSPVDDGSEVGESLGDGSSVGDGVVVGSGVGVRVALGSVVGVGSGVVWAPAAPGPRESASTARTMTAIPLPMRIWHSIWHSLSGGRGPSLNLG
jgi:hypothetical protein